MDKATVDRIEYLVGSGKVVVSADDDTIAAMVQEAVKSGRTASFYVSREQSARIRDAHWTPELIEASNLEPVSSEEKASIEAELGISDIGRFRFGSFSCESGHRFGALAFLRQGIREHGVDSVRSIFEMKNSALLRVNPHFVVHCPECDQRMDGGITYEGDTYGGCSYPDPPVCR